MSKTHNAGIVTAYGAAVRGGYTGTYEEFCAQQAEYAKNARDMKQAVSDAKAIKESVESAVSAAETHANNANQSATNASNSATQASGFASNANQSAESASQFADNASNSADDANQSAMSAQTSADNANTSEQNARQSAEDAHQSAEDAASVLSNVYTKSEIDSTIKQKLINAFPTDSATGDIVSFNDGADDIPVKNLNVDIELVQDLHGYDKPWVAGGGKNLLNPSLLKDQSGWNIVKIYANEGTVLTASTSTPSGKGLIAYFRQPDGEQGTANGVVTAAQHKAVTQTVGSDGYVELVQRRSDGTNSFQDYNWQIEKGSEATDYEPYENICPIYGWTGANVVHVGRNLWDGEWEQGRIANGVNVSNAAGFRSKNKIEINPNTTYYLHVGSEDYGNFWVSYYDKDEVYIPTANSSGYSTLVKNSEFVTPENAYYMRFFLSAATAYKNDISINYPSTNTAYYPYMGGIAIIDWTDEAGEVFGGTLNVTTGELTVNTLMVDLGTLNWIHFNTDGRNFFSVATSNRDINGKIICSAYPYMGKAYDSQMESRKDKTLWIDPTGKTIKIKDTRYANVNTFKEAVNGVQLCYDLITPRIYQLTPNEVKTILGANNIYANTGDVSVEYRADIKKYIDKVVATAVSALS